MTDEEFKRLQEQIEKTMNWLEVLQDLHKKETGQYYVRPIRLSKKTADKA